VLVLVLMLGQTGWHGAHALVLLPSLTSVPLPPCSPERVWLYLGEREVALSPRGLRRRGPRLLPRL